jgi:hypothetical protein
MRAASHPVRHRYADILHHSLVVMIENVGAPASHDQRPGHSAGHLQRRRAVPMRVIPESSRRMIRWDVVFVLEADARIGRLEPGAGLASSVVCGYYVLATPSPPEHVKAAMLTAAQDLFFADEASLQTTTFLQDLAQNFSGRGHSIMPTPVTIGGRVFQRLLMEERLLSRIVLATEIRCHIVIFSFIERISKCRKPWQRASAAYRSRTDLQHLFGPKATPRLRRSGNERILSPRDRGLSRSPCGS